MAVFEERKPSWVPIGFLMVLALVTGSCATNERAAGDPFVVTTAHFNVLVPNVVVAIGEHKKLLVRADLASSADADDLESDAVEPESHYGYQRRYLKGYLLSVTRWHNNRYERVWRKRAKNKMPYNFAIDEVSGRVAVLTNFVSASDARAESWARCIVTTGQG